MSEHINLRGDPASETFLGAVRGVLGFDLPLIPNTTIAVEGCVAFWLGPDEWLLSTKDSATTARELQAALSGQFAAVTEVGGGNEVMVLEAAIARELLATECPFDLHPGVFGPGQCAQTRFAHAVVLLRPLDNGDMEVTVRRSFAAYIRQHLFPAHTLEAR